MKSKKDSSSDTNGFQTAIKDDESLMLFIRKMKEFDTKFCSEMSLGSDYTIRLEVHGNKGEVLHVRVYHDSIDRPRGAEKRVEDKTKS